MVLQELEGKTEERRFSLAEQAKALSAVLLEEFGVPFTLFDATSGTVVLEPDPRSPTPVWEREPYTDLRLVPAVIRQLATDGRARGMPLRDNRYQVSLLTYTARKPALLAVGVWEGLLGADGGPETSKKSDAPGTGAAR